LTMDQLDSVMHTSRILLLTMLEVKKKAGNATHIFQSQQNVMRSINQLLLLLLIYHQWPTISTFLSQHYRSNTVLYRCHIHPWKL
jgi:hypothetical protein